MDSTITLDDILTIEDSSDVLEICCPDTGIPLWSTIRSVYMRTIMEDLLYAGSMPMMHSSGMGGIFKAVKALTKSFAHNKIKIRSITGQFPIVLMSTGPRLVRNDGQYFNCLGDYFISTYPDRTLAIEDLFNWRWPFPRKYSNILMHSPLRVEGAIKGRFRSSHFRSQARDLVNLVSERASRFLAIDLVPQKKQRLELLCAIGSASLLPRYQRYKKILSKSGAQILIKEEACYGGADNVSAMLAAKHLGIVTAEYQHGAISKGHDAYNYSPTLRASEKYSALFPDYVLVYGAWWGRQVNVPVSIVPIGNPHRTEMLRSMMVSPGERRQVLVLGDGIDTDIYLKLCNDLANSITNRYQVIFRPHPLERASVSANYPEGFAGRVRIDSNQDVYDSFKEAGAVVSEVSTGLFEAIGVVQKVFIWDTPKARFSYPVHPFRGFSDASELAHLILDEGAGRVNHQQMESIWAPNWRSNYRDFIERVVQQ